MEKDNPFARSTYTMGDISQWQTEKGNGVNFGQHSKVKLKQAVKSDCNLSN